MSEQASRPLGSRHPNVLTWGYLVGGALYPVWHLFAPAQAIDPWSAWFAVSAWTVVVSLLLMRFPSLEKHGQKLRLSCVGLITTHVFTLAALNDLHPYFTTACVLVGVHAVIFERKRKGLVAYAGLIGVLVVATFAFTGQPVIFAYGFSIAAILGLAYWRLGVQLELERIGRQNRSELEAAVALRTQELQRANEQLQTQIQERERLEEELLVAHKMEALGRLAGGVAHDYNNLLTAILGYAELLTDRFPKGSPGRAEADQIENAAQRAASLTRQLLAFSRARPSETSVLDPNAVLREMEPMLRRLIREDIELVLSIDSKLAPVRANRSQLEQVILNLVVNARDSMHEGGHVEIRTRDEHWSHQRWAVLQVSDTGSGMDAETRARVFDPFFTTKGPGEGTGLGLSTVYAIVQRAGGSIRVTSEPGAGSQFEIHWPATSEPLEIPEPRQEPVPRGQERVLVVDDDREVRQLVCRMLEKLGYATEQAASGTDALLLASERTFNLVLTDVVMPGMSGLALAKQLAASEIDVPLLFMSGHLDHPALRGGNLPVGSQLLSKPFTIGGLGTKVRQALDAAPPG